MTSPIKFRRTPSLARTALYSESISSLTSQIKVASSNQSRRRRALGFGTGRPGLKPAIPATRTEVSTTPLRGSFRTANSDLRQLPFLGTVRADRFGNLGLGEAG